MKNFLKKLYTLVFNKMVTAHLTDKGVNLYLEVPYIEKDIVKNLGAKWDPVKKKWFIQNNRNTEPFKQWLPSKKESEDENLRAEYFYLAKTYRDCYECNKSTLVWAIILPEGFEAIDVDAMEYLEKKGVITESAIFCKNDYLSLVSHVTYISQAAIGKN